MAAPRKDEGEHLNKILAVRFTEEDLAQLRIDCAIARIPITKMARRAIKKEARRLREKHKS